MGHLRNASLRSRSNDLHGRVRLCFRIEYVKAQARTGSIRYRSRHDSLGFPQVRRQYRRSNIVESK